MRSCVFSSRPALLASALLLASSLPAQTHRVAKAEKVTRAVGVYEWTGELAEPEAARLVPVSLFIEGHLQDAGVYLARPVPFALGTGFVYAIERAGEPLGMLDLEFARNIVSQRAAEESPAGAWYGYGKFQPPAAVPKAPALHTTEHPSAIVASSRDGRPHLGSRSGNSGTSEKPDSSAGSPTGSKPKGDPDAKNSPPSPQPAKPAETPGPEISTPPASPEDPDRPHMSRRDTGTTPAGSEDESRTASGTTSATDTADDPDRPSLRRRGAEDGGNRKEKKGKKESGSGVTGPARSLNDDPDRPTLRHGGAEESEETPPLTGTPANLHQAIAVSDPAVADTHVFSRGWESPTERARVLAAFQVLARPRAANYLAQNKLQPGRAVPATAANTSAPSPGKPARSTTVPSSAEDQAGAPTLRRGKPGTSDSPADVPSPSAPTVVSSGPAKASRTGQTNQAGQPGKTRNQRNASSGLGPAGPLALTAESLNGYTLSYGGLPTFVYSAVVSTREGSSVHLTLVAQQLPSGELQVALSSLTDDAHLDRTPWLRLVDAVDISDSHRASFLFELRAQSSRQFALYSLVTAQAEQSFVTGVME